MTTIDGDLNGNADDHVLIDLSQEYAILIWTRRFNVTRRELQIAVDEVGNSAEFVQMWFYKRRASLEMVTRGGGY